MSGASASAPASHPRARRAGASRRGAAARAAGSSRAGAGPRVRWDRVGKVALLCVLVALVYLYVSAGFRMLSTWQQARHDSVAVASMEREHARLVHQHEQL